MDELEDLLDQPSERLDVEYKDWLDFSDEVKRAKLAKTIAALSNNGGGYIVFGVDDKTKAPTGANPYNIGYSQDDIHGVVRKYLEPMVQITVRNIRESTIVSVPPHGVVPICAKKNGPDGPNNRPQEITKGFYYTRKIGPESAQISSEAEWLPIIRRCVMQERTSLLAALTAVMDGRKPEIKLPALDVWHNALYAAWQAQENVLGTAISANNAQFSYAVIKEGSETLDLYALPEMLRQINREARDRVNTGWSLFFPFEREPIRPYFTSDPAVHNESEEFLEANLSLDSNRHGARDTDMWRVSTSGLASTIRPIRLDFLTEQSWSPKNFSINEATRHTGELVRHAQGLAQRFDSSVEVAFICEWRGLANRTLADPNADWNPRVARANSRATRGTWPLGEVISDWPTIVAELIAPLVRAFGTDLTLGPDWVLAEAKHWRPIGNQWP